MRASKCGKIPRVHAHQSPVSKGASLPLFTPLGYSRENGTLWLWFQRADSAVVGCKAARAGNVATLAEIVPDLQHWAIHYPGDKVSEGIGWHKVRSALVAAAMSAGPYDPPEHLKPRGRGRPKKTQTPR